MLRWDVHISALKGVEPPFLHSGLSLFIFTKMHHFTSEGLY